MSTRTVKPVRSEIRSLEPYVPGKPVEELERELHISNAIKLASNENPLGPSPLAVRAMSEAAPGVNRYPDGSSYYLREALSRFWKVPFEQTAAGAGSKERKRRATGWRGRTSAMSSSRRSWKAPFSRSI